MVTLEILQFSQIAVDNGLDNHVKSFTILNNLISLQRTLHGLEQLLGVDIIVNSGYRSPQVNELVHGATNSYHLYGLAADITIENSARCTLSDFKQLCKELRHTRFAEVVVHDTYVHVAIKKYV